MWAWKPHHTRFRVGEKEGGARGRGAPPRALSERPGGPDTDTDGAGPDTDTDLPGQTLENGVYISGIDRAVIRAWALARTALPHAT